MNFCTKFSKARKFFLVSIVKKAELKLEALTEGVLQSAFNNFAKFTVKHLCWSFFLIKLQAWWCATFSREKTLAQVFSCTFSEIFKKTYFVEHSQTDAWVKWTKKIVFAKSIQRETPVMMSFLNAVANMWVYSFLKNRNASQMLFFENWEVLQNINFTEQDCFWFPVTFSMCYLPYQW